ncbi:hypothetical protein SETIT_7G118800v2 [Setaria italica]|uniref:Uncharacterized protein n=1 Tax=Setaria italica TaxID=4555 RepID=A0A368RUQ8_SETIT|nr:hypothetical protein SETIT_7G118800v2 [Setaria italica]
MFWKGLLRSRHGNVPGWKRNAELASCAPMESFEKIHRGSNSAIYQTRTTRSRKIESMHSWRCGKSIAKYVVDMVLCGALFLGTTGVLC